MSATEFSAAMERMRAVCEQTTEPMRALLVALRRESAPLPRPWKKAR